jgi:hypothetical protein
MSTQNTHTNDLLGSITHKDSARAPAFMLLTHIGRRSGKVRRTILAVLCFDAQTKEIMAISAWSASDWYLNIQLRLL